MRWSKAHVSDIVGRTTTSPSTTTGARLQRAHPEDGRLRVVDHRHAFVQPQRAEVGHRERRALQFRRFERACARVADRAARPSAASSRVVLSCASLTTGTSSPRGAATPNPRCTAGCRWICGPSVVSSQVEFRFGWCRSAIVNSRRVSTNGVIGDSSSVMSRMRSRNRSRLVQSTCTPAWASGICSARQRHPMRHLGLHAAHGDHLRRRRRPARCGEDILASDHAVGAGAVRPERSTFSSAASFRTGGLARGRSTAADRRLLVSISSSAP